MAKFSNINIGDIVYNDNDKYGRVTKITDNGLMWVEFDDVIRLYDMDGKTISGKDKYKLQFYLRKCEEVN